MGYTSSTVRTYKNYFTDSDGNVITAYDNNMAVVLGTLNFGDFSAPAYWVVPPIPNADKTTNQYRFECWLDKSLASELAGSSVYIETTNSRTLNNKTTTASNNRTFTITTTTYMYQLSSQTYSIGSTSKIILNSAELDVTITKTDGTEYTAHLSWSGYIEVNRKFVSSTTTYKYYWHVNYDANGGSGAPSTQRYPTSGTNSTTDSSVLDTTHTFTIPSTIPTKDNYTFLGWSASSSATTAQYQPGGKIRVTARSNVTLYAVWEKSTPPLKTKVNGTWKDASEILVKVNGTWKTANTVYVKVNGTWKESK